MMATITTRLNPEENPGQETDKTAWVVGLEVVKPTSGGTATPFTMDDYVNLIAKGISAPRRENGVYVFEDGITTDLVNHNDIATRQFKDFAQESIATTLASNKLRLATDDLVDTAITAIDDFLDGLVRAKRIKAFGPVVESTDATYTDAGVIPINCPIKTFPAARDFLLTTVIGPGVTISVP